MATDVEVQYFSHLNGLTLGNNWGDLIRLLDKALVTGIDFTQITAASIDAQGDVHITLYSAHNSMLLQIVELTGFSPSSLNQKYRIKGVPNTTQLILKPALDIAERSITTIGAGKLASLGYEIIFRDTGDVKRVYRAKNPTVQHPFIRVDESLTSPDGTTGVYTSTYAKSAMVGLLENMTNIDDYQNPNVLQLPFDPSDPAKNWKITGSGTSVVRGWSRWYWGRNANANNNSTDSSSPVVGNRQFTLVGNKDLFYFLRNIRGDANDNFKILAGCGVYQSAIDDTVIPPWFLMTTLDDRNASTGFGMHNTAAGSPLMVDINISKFLCPTFNLTTRLSKHVLANAVAPDYNSGYSDIYSSTPVAALELPLSDADKRLRGNLDVVCYSGKRHGHTLTTPIVSENSMYVYDCAMAGTSSGLIGGFCFYMGELE
ncbi:hypothetical protein [Acinetobacter variabilis]|uniref:hypothetical protein n=1 Tax=Acinetobacter variabilis TaxID=70346 RepID=UPI002898C370|nr:hypothetical protein [Acinetobacter variabilis]